MSMINNQETEQPIEEGSIPDLVNQEEQNTPISDNIEPELEQDIETAILDLVNKIELEDQGTRSIQLQKWRRLELYFNNLVNVFWNETLGRWAEPDWDSVLDSISDDSGDSDLARFIPIYRAHAETIIAALSVNVPGVTFFPDDPDVPEDIDTAKTKSNIARLIQRKNKAPMLWLKMLYIYFNQGTFFIYNYNKEDGKFGFVRKPVFESVDRTSYDITCPTCSEELGQTQNPNPVEDTCPTCNYQGQMNSEPITNTEQRQIAVDSKPRKGECLEIFGPLQTKVSFYARKQEDCGYLELVFDQSVAQIRSLFPNKASKINPNTTDSVFESYVRYAPDYLGAQPENTTVTKAVWLRPWQFWLLGADKVDIINKLSAQFPDGLYVLIANNVILEFDNENLDDHWTISQNPLGSYVHGEPLGTALATIQDIRSEIVELQLQTMEHGIQETFVDPETLDLNKYGQRSAMPGAVTNAKSKTGRGLGDSFFQTKTATLSAEVPAIKEQIDADAQFTTGSVPAIYGGEGQGSKTASEYEQSAARAMQRLGNIWKILANTWADCLRRSTNDYVNNMEDDDHITEKSGSSFSKIAISKDSAQMGMAGHCEPDYSETLPINWAQRQAIVMRLMEMKDPTVTAVLTHPNNSELVKQSIGLLDIYIPGEQDRTRQLYEIQQLLQSAPLDQNTPSVPTQPEIDDALVHIQIIKSWAISEDGMNAKRDNPQGFMNVILHMIMHEADATNALKGTRQGTVEGQPQDTAATSTLS